MNNRQWVVTGMLAAAVMILGLGRAQAKGWDKKYVGSLPDASFASVETGSSGEKLRHLPYRDDSGKVDAAHLRAALRAWKKVKWQNQADAQPALAQLKNEESKLCATGQMKCGGGPKKPKHAKAKKTHLSPTAKAASAKPAKAPKVAKAAKPHKARHVAKAGPKPAKAPKVAKGAQKPAKAKIARKPAPKKSKQPAQPA